MTSDRSFRVAARAYRAWAQLDLPKCVAHVRKSENSGDRHFQFLSCDEVGELGKYRRRCGVCAAFRLDSKLFNSFEVGNRVDLIWREFQVFDRHGDISATENNAGQTPTQLAVVC
jgi:hypothetical protein